MAHGEEGCGSYNVEQCKLIQKIFRVACRCCKLSTSTARKCERCYGMFDAFDDTCIQRFYQGTGTHFAVGERESRVCLCLLSFWEMLDNLLVTVSDMQKIYIGQSEFVQHVSDGLERERLNGMTVLCFASVKSNHLAGSRHNLSGERDLCVQIKFCNFRHRFSWFTGLVHPAGRDPPVDI